VRYGSGDWDGSGVTRIGVYSNGSWYLDMNGNGAWDGSGIDRVYPIWTGLDWCDTGSGDWDGSGVTRIGVYWNGSWYLDIDGNGVWDGSGIDRYIPILDRA